MVTGKGIPAVTTNPLLTSQQVIELDKLGRDIGWLMRMEIFLTSSVHRVNINISHHILNLYKYLFLMSLDVTAKDSAKKKDTHQRLKSSYLLLQRPVVHKTPFAIIVGPFTEGNQ